MGASLLGGISAGASIAGKALDSVTGIRTNSYNAHLMEEQNALNRAHQTSERMAQQAYQTSEREAVQQYMNPDNIKSRYLAAGFNPVLAMGGTSSQVVSPQGATQGGSSGGMVSPLANPFQGGLGSDFAQIVEGLSKIGLFDSNKELINSQIKNYLADTSNKEILSEINKIEKSVQENLKDTRINKAFEEYTQAIIKTAQDSKNLSKTDSEIALNKAAEELNKKLAKYHGEKAVIAGILSKELINILTTWYSTQTTVQQSNLSTANKNNSEAALNTEDLKVRGEINEQTLQLLGHQVESAYRDNQLKGFQRDILKNQAIQERVKASHAEALFWRDFIMDSLTQGMNVFSSYQKGKFFKALPSHQQQQVRLEVERLERSYSTTSTTHYDAFGNPISTSRTSVE